MDTDPSLEDLDAIDILDIEMPIGSWSSSGQNEKNSYLPMKKLTNKLGCLGLFSTTKYCALICKTQHKLHSE
jgi:hypothetical protein